MGGMMEKPKFNYMRWIGKWLWIIVCQWLLSLAMLAILVLSLWNWLDYWRTSNWVRVDGTIISLKISNYDGSRVGTHWSGDGELSCQYAYAFEGLHYTGRRVGVERFDDSSPRSRRYRELKESFDKGKPIAVFVNPAAPSQSALFREA